MIFDQRATVTIEHSPARSQHGDGFHAIAFRQFTVGIAVAYLQHPKAGNQKQEHPHGEVLKNSDAPQRKTNAFGAPPAIADNLFRMFWIYGHNKTPLVPKCLGFQPKFI